LSLESAFTLRKKNTIRHLFHYATMALLLELPLLAHRGLYMHRWYVRLLVTNVVTEPNYYEMAPNKHRYSSAFSGYAWRFVNIVARAPVVLSECPNYNLITRYVNNIADLYLRYAKKIITEQMPELNSQIENNTNALSEDDMPRNMQGKPEAARIWTVEVALSSDAS